MKKVFAYTASGIGISGALVGTGYLVEAAHQRFLGYDLAEPPNPLAFPLAAGKLAVDTFILGFLWMSRHPILTTFGAVAVLAFAYLLHAHHASAKRSLLPIPSKTFGLLLAAVLCLGQIFLVDLPAMRIEDVLGREINGQPMVADGTVGGEFALGLWTDHVCSRIATLDDPALQWAHITCLSEPHTHAARLEGRYLLTMLITLVTIGLFAYSFLIKDNNWKNIKQRPGLIRAAYTAGTAFTSAALLAHLAMIPFLYTATTRSTKLQNVELTVDSQVASSPSSHVLIISRTGNHVTYFDPRTNRIDHILEEQAIISGGDQQDLLELHFTTSLGILRSSTPPPELSSESGSTTANS